MSDEEYSNGMHKGEAESNLTEEETQKTCFPTGRMFFTATLVLIQVLIDYPSLQCVDGQHQLSQSFVVFPLVSHANL